MIETDMKETYIRIGIIFIIFITLIQCCSSQERCLEEIKNKNTHIIVNKCTNIGTFSIGVFHNNSWIGLSYNYPYPWKGTFLAIRVNDKIYSTSPYIKDSESMDPYVKISPTRINNSAILTSWKLPEEIYVEELIRSIEKGTIIEIRIKNDAIEPRDVSARLTLDVKIHMNDGGILFINSMNRSTEIEMNKSEIDFDYWEIMAGNLSITGYFERIPDRFVVANWRKTAHKSSWEYKIDTNNEISSDCSVILLYGPESIHANEDMNIKFIYKLSTCFDNIRNNGESDVDCGGPCSRKCPIGNTCYSTNDCESGLICENNICVTTDIVRKYQSQITIFAILFLTSFIIMIIWWMRSRINREKAEKLKEKRIEEETEKKEIEKVKPMNEAQTSEFDEGAIRKEIERLDSEWEKLMEEWKEMEANEMEK